MHSNQAGPVSAKAVWVGGETKGCDNGELVCGTLRVASVYGRAYGSSSALLLELIRLYTLLVDNDD